MSQEQEEEKKETMKNYRDLIVEGYGRNRYKQDFIRFLVYAHSSCDEATS